MANNPTEQNKRTSSGPAMSAEEKNENQPNLQEKNKDRISTSNSSVNKATGTKRLVPASPSSPSVSTPGSNGHLVYVRRRLETEQGKTMSSPIGKDETVIKEQNVQNLQNMKILQNEKNAESEKNDEKVENEQKSDEAAMKPKEDWKERFIRLQVFLRNLDQSNQDEYMKMLRSLSSVGRSKHAVELEKRAIHLLLEEGKELHRMKILDVLGKNSQTNPSLHPSQLSSPVQPQLER